MAIQNGKNFVDKSTWNAANIAINNTNVTTPGEINAMFAAIGVTVNYGSQDDLGKRIEIAEANAAAFTYTPNGTLYGGVYQLVQVDSGATALKVGVGLAAFLKQGNTNAQNYVVTSEDQAITIGMLCGVFLNTITPGNFGFIQVAGKVNVKYKAGVTATVDGGAVIVAGAGDGTFDCPTQSGSVTYTNIGAWVGNALATPVGGSTLPVQMRSIFVRS